MELRHLRYFALVAEELHFGRAAERAGIAQPPLSQQIKSLEAELGVSLFRRTNRRVELTDAGRALLPDARRLLQDAEQASLRARMADRGLVGQVRLGFVGSTAFGWLPKFVRAMRERAPDVALSLRELTSEQQRDELRAGRIDLGLSRYLVDDPQLAGKCVLVEPLRLAAPATYRIARGTEPVSMDELRGLPFVLFPRQYGPVLYDQIVGLCRRSGFSPEVIQEAIQMPTIVSLVAADMGVAIVPAAMEQLGLSAVTYRPLRDATGVEPGTELVLTWKADEQSELLRRAIDIAVDDIE